MAPVTKTGAETAASAADQVVVVYVLLLLDGQRDTVIEQATVQVLACLAGHNDIRLGFACGNPVGVYDQFPDALVHVDIVEAAAHLLDRKSTRLNSSH